MAVVGLFCCRNRYRYVRNFNARSAKLPSGILGPEQESNIVTVQCGWNAPFYDQPAAVCGCVSVRIPGD